MLAKKSINLLGKFRRSLLNQGSNLNLKAAAEKISFRDVVAYGEDIYRQHRISLLVRSVDKAQTKRSRNNLLAFFIGKEQLEEANLHGTDSSLYHTQQESARILRDQDCVNDILLKGDYSKVPKPGMLFRNSKQIIKNIKLGREIMQAKRITAPAENA